ncbi:MAG: CYTH and CHAD domain-containing protein [Acidimicrobiales bacterium]
MGVAGAIEREVKLAGWPGLVIPDLSQALPGVSVTVLGSVRLDATYFDTADLRLARSGASLRYRSEMAQDADARAAEPEPPWTVKLADGTEGPGLARRELTFDGRERRIPSEASSVVLGITRGAPLVAVARLRTERARLRLFDAEGAILAELDDDEVSVLVNGPSGRRRMASRFRELEVELGDGADPAILDTIVGVLRSVGAGPPDPTPKVMRALGPQAYDAPDVVVQSVDRNATVAEAITAAVAASVVVLINHDAGVRLGEDPEDVHKARVATRRLRSDLRTFRALLDPEWAGDLRDELRWVAGLLGAVRDADVLIERLTMQARRLDPADHGPARSLLSGLDRRRDEARTELLVGMESSRYTALLDRLVVAARSPVLVVAEVTPADSAREVLPGVVLRPWRHLASAVAALGDDPTDDQLHEIRIRAKRCRYAAEAVAPVVGKQARTLAAAVAEVQGVLGDFHDAVVAGAWLREHGRTVSAEEALVAGQLMGVEDQLADRDRRLWRKAWKRASGHKLRTWIPNA